MSTRHVGLFKHRLKANPEERRFADAWRDECERGRLLDHLLDERHVHTGSPPPCALRDETVAATVIQWLGSPVGQSFLEDLGYTRKVKP